MLYPIYKAIKDHLTTADTGNTIQGIEWYNVQYESSITSTPRLFVEFPEKLKIDQLTKQEKRTDLITRIHVVTQAISQDGGIIQDSAAEEHEVIATWVANNLDRFIPLYGTTKLSTAFQIWSWQHFHKHKGWMVTFIEFTARKTV